MVDGSDRRRRGINWPAVQPSIVRETLHYGVGLSCVHRDILRIDLKISVILEKCKVLSDRTK